MFYVIPLVVRYTEGWDMDWRESQILLSTKSLQLFASADA
jgi:hypothetical protein